MKLKNNIIIVFLISVFCVVDNTYSINAKVTVDERNTKTDTVKTQTTAIDTGIQSIDSLIEVFKSRDPEVASRAAQKLVAMKRPDLKRLNNALSDDNENVRQWSAWSLKTILSAYSIEQLIEAFRYQYSFDYEICNALEKKGKPAVKPLIVALDSWPAGCNAAKVLGRIKDTSAVMPLIERIYQRGKWVNPSNIEALGDIGDQRAVLPCITVLRDTHLYRDYSMSIVSDALAKFGQSSVKQLIDCLDNNDSIRTYWAIKALSKIHDTSAVMPLIGCLNNKGTRARREAIEGLGSFMEDGRVVVPLYNAINDKDRQNQVSVINSLGNHKDTIAIRYLFQALKHRSSLVRAYTVQALSMKNDPQIARSVIAMLLDEDRVIRGAAAQSLDNIYRSSAMLDSIRLNDENIVNLLKTIDDKVDVRGEAMIMLGELHEPRSIEPIIKELEDEDPKQYAKYALFKLGEVAIDDLIEAMGNTKIRWKAAEVLSVITAPSNEKLIEAMNHPDPLVRGGAIWVLGVKKESKGLGLIEASLSDTSIEIRSISAWALGELKNESSIVPLIDALNDSQHEVKRNVVGALVKIGGKAVDSLISFRKSGIVEHNRWIDNALWATGDPKAIEALKRRNEPVLGDTVGFNVLINGEECILFRMDKDKVVNIDTIIFPAFLGLDESEPNLSKINKTKAGYVDDIVYNDKGWVACLSKPGESIDLVRYTKGGFDYLQPIKLPKGSVAKCLALKDDRLYIGGDHAYLGYCDLDSDKRFLQNINIPQEQKDKITWNAIDALFIEQSNIIAIDNIVTPKYMLSINIAQADRPCLDTIIQMSEHGVYETVWNAAINSKYIAVLSSTSGRDAYAQHIAIYDKNTLQEIGYLSNSKKASRLIGYPELSDKKLSYWQSVAFIDKWLAIAHQYNGLELYDLNSAKFSKIKPRNFMGSSSYPTFKCKKKKISMEGSCLTIINYPSINKIGVVADVDGKLITKVFSTKDF